MTPVEALAQIRALCDERERELISILGPGGPAWVRAVRKILGAAPVDVTPPQGTVRDALVRELDLIPGLSDGPFREGIIERILALVRPVEGVIITPDERTAFETADSVLRHHGFTPSADLLSGVAARLAASS